MRNTWRNRYRLTTGERRLALAYCVVALSGAGFALLTVTRLNGEQVLARGLIWYEAWIVLGGAFGAAMALFLAGDRMGTPGPRGTGRAVFGAVWVSFIGALIAGTLALPLFGTMFGPFTLAVTLAGAPLLAVLWFANLMAAHALLVTWRKERDTIFASPPLRQPRQAQSAQPSRLAGR